MATIFRRPGTRTFTIEYFDHTGKRRRVTSHTPERRIAERIAASIEQQVALRRAGLVDPKAEALADHATRPIESHVQDWLADVSARGRTGQHVAELATSVRRVLGMGAIETLADLSPSAVQLALGKIRQEKRADSEGEPSSANEPKFSLRTLNRAVRAVKSFARWLTRDGRLRDDPIAFLPAFNDATDRRRFRRALTNEEVEALCHRQKDRRPFADSRDATERCSTGSQSERDSE